MLRPIDEWYASQPEPLRSFFEGMREIIMALHPSITETLKYGMPFFCIKNKMFCYLWMHKKYKRPYLGIVEGSAIGHKDLLQEKRARMKILLLDAEKDIPASKVKTILKKLIKNYL